MALSNRPSSKTSSACCARTQPSALLHAQGSGHHQETPLTRKLYWVVLASLIPNQPIIMALFSGLKGHEKIPHVLHPSTRDYPIVMLSEKTEKTEN